MEMKDAKPAEIIETQDMETKCTENKSPRELWEELGSYSTLHGLHFVLNKSSKVRRIVWIILMLGGGTFLANQIYTGWKKVVAFQILVQHDNEFRDALDFPAVSICNNNMMRRSRINGTFAQRYLDVLGGHQSSAWPDPESGLNHSLNLEKAVLQYGQMNLTEMLSDDKCKWLGSPCKSYQFTSFFHFQYGRCYTFNSGKNDQSILQTTQTGNSAGFSISLDAQPEEYYGLYSREGTGFRVIIHGQEEYPSLEKGSWQISPGSNVEMRIQRKEVHSLPAPYPKSCREEKGYSQSVCLHKCYTDFILKICRCQTLGMLSSEPINFPWCTPWQIIHCFYVAMGMATSKFCNCNVPCYRVKYDVHTSSMYYPSQTFWETFAQKENLSADPQRQLQYQAWFRQRYLKLSVFYGELEAEISREIPVYELTDLASDLGGSMGLFLGCSVLTVFEFIDVLVLMCLSYWRRKQRRKHTISSD